MNQKQKDIIREEFEDRCNGELTNQHYHCNWIISKLDQAYQQGAKDKVEEIIREVEKNEWFELNADWDYIKNEVISK